MQNRLLFLPDENMLNVLQYLKENEIENTREFQSEWVKKCTEFVDIKKAFSEKNLYNMIWINERHRGDLSNYKLGDFINYSTFLVTFTFINHNMRKN